MEQWRGRGLCRTVLVEGIGQEGAGGQTAEWSRCALGPGDFTLSCPVLALPSFVTGSLLLRVGWGQQPFQRAVQILLMDASRLERVPCCC